MKGSGNALIVKLGLKPKGGETEGDDAGESEEMGDESESDERAAMVAFAKAMKSDDTDAQLDAFHTLMGACGY